MTDTQAPDVQVLRRKMLRNMERIINATLGDSHFGDARKASQSFEQDVDALIAAASAPPARKMISKPWGKPHDEDSDCAELGCVPYAPPAPTLQRMIAEARPFVIPAELIAAGSDLARRAQTVMDYLAQQGGSIVPHLLDDDDNPGEYLRQAIAAWHAAVHPGGVG